MGRGVCGVIVGGLLLLGVAGVADATPVLTFNEKTGQDTLPFSGTLGWLFTKGGFNPVTINGLSWWDEKGDGLSRAHMVGIWNTVSGELLRSVLIPAGKTATLEGQWRTVSIDPLTITDATIYAIGGQTTYDDPDRIVFGTTLTYESPLLGSFYSDAYSSGSSGFSRPNAYFPSSKYGTFGPSFSVAVPEPASLGLLGIAGGCLLRRRRR